MVTKENITKLREIIIKRRTSGLTALTNEELLFFRDNMNQQEHKADAIAELQRRHDEKGLWLNKWGLIISAGISILALILSALAYFKP